MAFAGALSLLSGQAAWRRRTSVLLGALALGAPLLAPDAPVLRAAAALYLLWACIKVVDLARDPLARNAGFRVVHALVLHDLRRDGFQRDEARPELRLGLVGSAVANGAFAWGAVHVALFESALLADPWRWLLRQAAGLGFAYFGVEGALRFFELIYRCCGLRPPVLHDRPILSRSIREFWGRRWNRVVGHWLLCSFFRPLASRGWPRLGTLAAFTASGVLHLYFTWAAVGLEWGLCMAAFFPLQVPLLLLEERWKQQTWPTPLRRLWTLGWLSLASPLFVAPTLAIISAGLS
jgi:hypothetical protein